MINRNLQVVFSFFFFNDTVSTVQYTMRQLKYVSSHYRQIHTLSEVQEAVTYSKILQRYLPKVTGKKRKLKNFETLGISAGKVNVTISKICTIPMCFMLIDPRQIVPYLWLCNFIQEYCYVLPAYLSLYTVM
jgi:hypothetical protein